MAGGLAAVVVVSALVARFVWGTPDYGEVTNPISVETSTTTEPRLLTEAELFTGDVLEPAGIAGATAWVLREYFTLDGGDFRGQLGVDDSEVGTFRSYVDSVDVQSVKTISSKAYSVRAVVTRMESVDGSGYRRLPPLCVEVVLSMGEDGFEMIDLPVPVELPEVGIVPPLAETEEMVDPPEQVRRQAIAVLSRAGTPDQETLKFSRHLGYWRGESVVDDPAGVRWSLVVWLNESGEEVTPIP